MRNLVKLEARVASASLAWSRSGRSIRLLIGPTLVAMVLATTFAPAAKAAPMLVPLSAGVFHTCALTAGGGVKCWGAGGDGALGDGTFDNSNVPVDVTGLGSGVAAISAGWYHTCALTTAGGAKCWGDNSGGQLGDGTNTVRTAPVDVTGLSSGVAAISGGGFHTCALTTAGGVKCWGANGYGQIGDGTNTARTAPVDVTGLTGGVAAITTGYYHTCAVMTGGGVKCWGDNFYGQLGDGTTTEHHDPVDVTGLSGVVGITAGESHTCALTTGGGAECWGDNGYGELGDGTFDRSNVPVAVTGLSSGVASISSHGIHTCALTTGGGVKCWGDNFRGQLGDGTSSNVRNVPADVTGLPSGVAAIAAGYYHTCALTTSGTVKCWGYNSYGELGDGTTTNSNVPVNVLGTFVSGFIDSVAANLGADGTLTTDSEGDGATPSDPVETTVTTPNAGMVSITETQGSPLPSPFTVLDFVVEITAPPATPANPLTIKFVIDASALPTGVTSTNLQVLRNGVPIPPCTGAPSAVPDPCVSSRATLGDDAVITILTSHASTWTFGIASTLIIEKVVNNNHGGTTTCPDFSFQVNGGNATPFESDCSNSMTVEAGTYNVTEPAVAGYSTTYNDCSNIVLSSGDTATCTITNDDQPAHLKLVQVVVNDNGGDASASDFTVSATGPSGFSGPGPSQEQDVDAGTYSLSNTAPPGYSAGAWVCTGGSQNGASITLGNGETATCTITDDDAASEIAIADVSVTEANSGTSPATFSVTLSAPSTGTVTVDWATLGTDALAGEDYAAATGTVTFAPGDVDEPITIDVYGDTTVEADETFRVLLSNAVGAIITDGSGTGTIVNDDVAVSADLSIVKTGDHDATTNPVGAGQRLVYTLTLTNEGPSAAEDIQISDALPRTSTPNDARFCEVVSPATTCDTTVGTPYGSATAIPAIGMLVTGETRTFRIGYTVDPGAPSGSMENTASIASATSDPNPINDSSTVAVRVDALPVASFTFSPSAPAVGATVSFDGRGSTDDGTISQYAWAFGDGATATGATTTHVYSAAGSYAVALTVTDVVGGTSTATRSVAVSPAQTPSAHRLLRGTITRLVAFGPGGAPANTSEPLAGAKVDLGREGGSTTTDAQGAYAFPNVTCPSNRCTAVVTGPGSSTVLASRTVTLGPDPSTTTLDIVTGSLQDQLFLSGEVLAPASPPAQTPTIAVRVYSGTVLISDSAMTFGGPGGFGPYRLALGKVGGGKYMVGAALRVVLVENGVEVGSTTVAVPALTGSVVLATAADLVAQ
jgi:uncharacterized repeat protein (TIGR01451 family)